MSAACPPGCAVPLPQCRKRAPYIAYLTRCRQGLQTTQAHLERLLQRVLRDKEVANRYFTTVCVRLLLESKEAKIKEFIQGSPAVRAVSGRMVLDSGQGYQRSKRHSATGPRGRALSV